MADPVYLITPKMTSASAPSPFAASASTNWTSDITAWKAFSGLAGSSGDYWASTAVTGWLKLDWGSSVTITGYALSSSGSTNMSPADWTFEGSDDDSSWTTLDTQTGLSSGWASGVLRYFAIASASYRYYRINISANAGNVDRIAIAEMFFQIATPTGGSGGGGPLVGGRLVR